MAAIKGAVLQAVSRPDRVRFSAAPPASMLKIIADATLNPDGVIKMNANFAEILSMQLDDIKPLKPLPPGSYLAVISNDPPPHTEQRGKNNNHCIVFKIKLMQALDQSPSFQDQLYDALDGKSLSDVPINHTLWLTNDSMYRVKIFFEDHLGIRGMGIGDALANAVGKQLIVVIGHYERDGQIRMEIKSTAKV